MFVYIEMSSYFETFISLQLVLTDVFCFLWYKSHENSSHLKYVNQNIKIRFSKSVVI